MSVNWNQSEEWAEVLKRVERLREVALAQILEKAKTYDDIQFYRGQLFALDNIAKLPHITKVPQS